MAFKKRLVRRPSKVTGTFIDPWTGEYHTDTKAGHQDFNRNKPADAQISPAVMLASALGDQSNALAAATKGGIEAQEAEGQRRLTKTFNRLPWPIKYGRNVGFPTDLVRKLGFVVTDEALAVALKEAEQTNLGWVAVTPPPGWTLRPTDHSMYSAIFDEKDRKRGSIFYKAAFYDTDASVSFYTRYYVTDTYEEVREGQAWASGKTWCELRDRATDAVVFATAKISKADYAKQDLAREEAVAKMKELLPNHADVLAYWED